MKLSRLASMGLAGVFLTSGALAHADSDSDRIKKLEEQLKAITVELQKLRDEAATRDKERLAGFPGEVAKPAGQKPDGMAKPTAPGLKFSGDLDFRLDLTGEHSREIGIIPEGDQGQFRGRFRLKMQTPVTDRSEAEIYLASSVNQSPTAGYVTFSDFSRGKPITFKRAFFNYYFGAKENPKTPFMSFGKIQNPYWRGEIGGYASEIFWDNDVDPEGLAIKVPIVANKKLSVTATTGFYTINLPNKQLFRGLTTDTNIFSTQVKADSGFFHGAISYHVIDNLNSGLLVPTVTASGVNAGLTDTTPGTSASLLSAPGLQSTNAHYAYNNSVFGFGANTFNIVNLSAQLAPKVKPGKIQPFLHYEYLNNGSVNFENDGWGVTLGINKSKLADGKASSKGDYTLWFTYRDVSSDAALATFADSDLGGGTDYRGYQLAGNYRLQDNLAFRAAWQSYQGFPVKTNSVTRLFLDLIRYF